MSDGNLNWIGNFIWGIADDVLRDLYVRGKYRDVILPMTVLRRLDAELEATKQAVINLRNAYSQRYVGSLVADFHRNLLKGGIFLYPADQNRKEGRLRLMYEANPLGFVAEQAGGAASTGYQRIMDIMPQQLHQRTPLILGNKNVVEQTVAVISGG